MPRRWNNRLALRLLLLVLAINALLSLLATSLQLYLTFQRQDEALQRVTSQIEQGFGQSLSSALWSFDKQQVGEIIDGIFANADIGALNLYAEQLPTWTRGPKDPDEQLQITVIDLVHSDPVRGVTTVGTLEIGLSRAGIWSNLYQQVVVLFLSNMAKTGIASIAILIIFFRLVSRHLRQVSDYVSRPDWLTVEAPLQLDRPSTAPEDDLDAVAAAINSTRKRFQDVNRDLAATSEQLRLVLDTTMNGIIGLNAQGVVEVINPAARHMLHGISDPTPFNWPEEIRFLDVIDLHPLDASNDPINRALIGQSLFGETHAMTRKGQIEKRYVRVSGAVVKDPKSDLRCVIVLDDVSQLEKNRQQIERKGRLDALGQLTGGIAHDFNNLLATILYAMQLTRADNLSERSDRVLETALGAVERGRELTGRLLAFAKQQPGVARSRPVSEVFAEFEALVRPSIEADVAITFVPPDPDMLIYCDHGQLDNALLNLVLNSRDAIKRGGKGGRITVKARPLDEIDADVSLRRQDPYAYIADGMKEAHAEDIARHDARAYRYVEISVTDDGPGMSEEVKDRALDPFFTTKDASSGSGLGLSMVYGFIQKSDGELRIYSELGFGSTIRIVLPRGTSENAREEPMTRLPMRRGDGQTILLVEDEESLLGVMEDLVQELGFRFRSASSGQAALDLIESGAAVDLMLTDIVMPNGMSGFELARRARDLRPELPVVYMSGYTGFTSTEMGDVVGPMLQKPCPPAQLAEVLTEALAAGIAGRKS
ncbi:ATP-binding protein [Roseobacter sinensis]|uniref:histidine kinase n=1 Tax=Roseobacter sinensis TaxID=2931391 RepID=A0ABT3BFF9_9RHOB|nr:ATP-binding protein [Roseobacter sp. WL0113]MCV3272124.1 response regulator [Roseobacter sp. WL0113]